MKLNFLNLGIVKKHNGRVIAHRALIKILINPFLRRYFGIELASNFDKWEFQNYQFIKLPVKRNKSLWEELKFSWVNEEITDEHIVELKHWLF